MPYIILDRYRFQINALLYRGEVPYEQLKQSIQEGTAFAEGLLDLQNGTGIDDIGIL